MQDTASDYLQPVLLETNQNKRKKLIKATRKESQNNKVINPDKIKERNRIHSKAYTPMKKRLLHQGLSLQDAKKQASAYAKNEIQKWLQQQN